MTDAAPPCPDCAERVHVRARRPAGLLDVRARVVAVAGRAARTRAPVIRDAGRQRPRRRRHRDRRQDLKVKGSSAPIKAGTKVRNIRLVDGVGDHDIDCKVDGFGAMQLKSSVVKKA